MERIVQPELLDVLPAEDPRALRSRRDLRRINAWMGHSKLMSGALAQTANGEPARQLVEIGSGDGHFLLSVARRLRGKWPRVDATLVDQLDALDPQTRDQFNRLGWHVRAEVAEVSEWLGQAPPHATETIISNLFLHQFHAHQLAGMLRLAARSARVVIALEPRRSWFTRLGGHLLWLIGCSRVTRHDAGLSIRAGFAGHELSALWPDEKNWELHEQSVGLFSHLFTARRKD